MTFRELQTEQAAWASYNFDTDFDPTWDGAQQAEWRNKKALHSFLGAVEEVGELAHSTLKHLQGIRGTPEQHIAGKKDAVADIIIYLADFCTREGFDLDENITTVWREVSRRDWRKYPKTGLPPEPEPSPVVPHIHVEEGYVIPLQLAEAEMTPDTCTGSVEPI